MEEDKVSISLKLPKTTLDRIEHEVNKHQDLFANTSHFIRAAVEAKLQGLRTEEIQVKQWIRKEVAIQKEKLKTNLP